MTKDLVCGMSVDEQETRFHSDYNNQMYYFCSAECKRKFDDHPDQFIQAEARKELKLD